MKNEEPRRRFAILRSSLFVLHSSLRSPKSSARHGFTLVELLVVIAIIGILIGMLIPAVQRLRESAARVQCSNNLKQVGLALYNYQERKKVFPAGYVSGVDAKGNDTGPGWGWASLILPFIEQQPLFDEIQFAKAIEAPENAAVRTRVIAVYRCPSDRIVQPTWMAKKYDAAGKPVAEICELAHANYIGVFGVSEPGVDGEGMLFRNSAIRLREVRDGASYTLFVGERATSLDVATWVGAVTAAELFPENSSNFVLGHTGEMKSPVEPSEGNNFSSDHPGGVNFVFVDGHVQFLTGSMSAAVFQALSTRAGGEQAFGDNQ